MTTTSDRRLPRVRASELTGRGWLNTGGVDLTLEGLRGKIVLLDFWTFCCINCLHVLDELRELEAQHRDVLVVIGVHSPKFVHEADPVALAAAVDRYEVRHPVLDDPNLTTWSAYAARAWPTLVVIDPEGYVVAQMAGEGHQNNVALLVRDLVAEHEAKGTLHRGDGPYVPPEPTSGTLRFPAKAVALPDGRLLVADAGHHSLAELEADGEALVRRIGSGERGLADGDAASARFSEPNGLSLVPEELRATLGYDVLVADTVNHALRGVRLADGAVTTVAGTGEQYMVGAADNVVAPDGDEPRADRSGLGYDGDPLGIRLSSPWDVAWSPAASAFVVAMAGNHTLWAFDPVADRIWRLAGTMNEGLVDGPADEAWFAQTSGLAVGPDGRLWLADSEVSALRSLDLPGTPAAGDAAHAVVGTATGAGLFDFGHRDGPADQALLQHPLGVAVLPDGSVAIADTYNGAIRRYARGLAADGSQAGPGEVTTLASGLAEPSGIVVLTEGEGVQLLVVESAAHRLTRVALPATLAGEILDAGAHRTQRPVTDLAPGVVRLDVVFTPAAGQKYDDRYGPSTRLQVSSTPPELLLEGAGDDVSLERALRLNPDVPEGVLHVTAHAASCDADPAIEYPACHLNAQDWGVPVRVTPGAADELTLPLHG
ncbi:NHL domain-containing thioredoxin family protein [Cellulomonas chengniuliangii]|uniref:NHL domain-containing thioredoxin family protein n=1 Tax=Cellulomonas chengniuliangii TaxID=2968084 RepID=A0ABY5KXF5_9CELL|nr:NHL domain-containing thioredoxin family protein [Cellulomonas chengniuliangii]MCC2309245.1 NHL domain-containing thioredoxin family protein [Cellulomonas chengniuliangii]UUI75181.1 NHL domain-containing thioredoxin family protein [Cellulomonas chengniuliangii]